MDHPPRAVDEIPELAEEIRRTLARISELAKAMQSKEKTRERD